MTATNMCSNFGGFRCSPSLGFVFGTDEGSLGEMSTTLS